MPSADLRSEWLYSSKLLRLTPVQRWSFVAALMWAVGEESDGFIGHDDLDLIPGFERTAIQPLLEQRLLAETVGGWFVCPNGESFEKSQTTKMQLEQMRLNNRVRKARSRAKKSTVVTEVVTVGVTRDGTVTQQAKQSKAKPSQADSLKEEGVVLADVAVLRKASRVSKDYAPPEPVIAALTVELGVSRQALRKEHAKFIDYWLAKSGRDGTKLDWDATWRNWMRNAAERGTIDSAGRANSPRGADAKAMEWQRLGQSMMLDPE